MMTNIASQPRLPAARIRHRRLMVLLAVLAVQCIAVIGSAQSVTSAIPGYISYQGRVLDSSGNLVGATAGGGSPVNRTVTFRIWDHPSNSAAANLIYSEQQTVTIADGEFSVLVGQGVSTAGSPIGFDEISKGPNTTPPSTKITDPGVFAGSSRYLGVTVDDGTGAAGNEITPRQQIVASAYAFRSKVAESLGTTGTALTTLDSGNVGVGTLTPSARFTIAGTNSGFTNSAPQFLVTDSSNPNERLRIGVDNTGNGTGFIQSFNEGVGAQNLVLNPNGGNVGIGSTSPATTLDVNGKLRVYDGSTGAPASGLNGGAGTRVILWPGTTTGTPFGFGINSSNMWLGVPSTASISFYNGTTESMKLNASGQLGIGKSPSYALDVSGRIFLDGGAGQSGLWLGENGTSKGFIGQLDTSHLGLFGQSGAGWAFTMDETSGRVGIGTTSPGCQLEVNGGIRARGGEPGGGGANNNGYAFSGSGGDNDSGMYSSTDGRLDFYSNSAFKMCLNGNGVGINATNQVVPLYVASSGSFYFSGGGGISWDNNHKTGNAYDGQIGNADWYTAAGVSSSPNDNFNVSIYADRFVACSALIAFSDRRIKDIIDRSDPEKDLEALSKIKVTDYQLKDLLAAGNAKHKGVIAQELREVMPEAVSVSTNFIPDIYLPAESAGFDAEQKKLTVTMPVSHNLKTGEIIRLYTDNGTTEGAVLEVPTPTQFVVKAEKATSKAFVFGRQVNDFLSVDYQAVSMLNVSAVQQLKKQKDAEIKALQEKNAELQEKLESQSKKLDALQAANKVRDARLFAIESLLKSGGKPVLQPASLKRTEGAE